MTRHLRQLGDQFVVSLPTDDDGYLGRECPECESYFKIVNGTGLPDITTCVCPYCGHKEEMSEFHTQAQIDYATSIVTKQVMGAVDRDMKDMARNFNRKCSGGLFSMTMDVQSSHSPIQHYCEEKLETHIECGECTLKYAVYGVFGYCPDCGTHNSLQILDKNLDIVLKMVAMAENADKDVAEKLIENALEDCISAFDGFGRELCHLFSDKATTPAKAEKISFQNHERAKKSMLSCFGIDISSTITEDEWKQVRISFQKRHLLAHTMGVVDQDYIDKTGDRSAIVGRKIVISKEDVRSTVSTVQALAEHLASSLRNLNESREMGT